MKNFDSFFDKIYNNRRELIRYFIVVFLCSVLRTVLTAVVGGGASLISWAVWAVVLFVLLKHVVFKNRLESIYLLLTQIMIYIICIAVLWFLNGVLVGVLSAIAGGAAALILGGVVTEAVCMLLMYKIVFRKK